MSSLTKTEAPEFCSNNRSFCQQEKGTRYIYINKEKLKDSDNNNLYIHENLCPGLREIYDACYYLKKEELISQVWSYNGSINIKIGNDVQEQSIKITHYDDIFEYIRNIGNLLD